MTDGDEFAWLRRRVADLEAEAEIAARLASYDDGGPGVERKYRFIAAEAANFAVTTLCRVTRVSRSAYYAWAAKADGPSLAMLEEAHLANLVWDVFWANRRRYGSPRVTEELWRQGIKVNHKTVESLMAGLGLQGLCGRRKLKTTRQDPKAAPARDLVKRDFSAAEPNKLLVGDIRSYPPLRATASWRRSSTCAAGAWSAGRSKPICAPPCAATPSWPRPAFGAGLAGATFHSDRGCQYTSGDYAIVCDRLRITQSMGSVGDSYDNAMAESFFSSLKRELVDVSHFSTIAEARLEVFEWVIWYNRKRLHSSLGYLTPEEFEEQFNDQQAA